MCAGMQVTKVNQYANLRRIFSYVHSCVQRTSNLAVCMQKDKSKEKTQRVQVTQWRTRHFLAQLYDHKITNTGTILSFVDVLTSQGPTQTHYHIVVSPIQS